MIIENDQIKILQEIIELQENRIKQLECQLSACLLAATGWSAKKLTSREDLGWCPAYEAVLELRLARDNYWRKYGANSFGVKS